MMLMLIKYQYRVESPSEVQRTKQSGRELPRACNLFSSMTVHYRLSDVAFAAAEEVVVPCDVWFYYFCAFCKNSYGIDEVTCCTLIG